MIKGLYIHIPFCSQICSYCDFTKKVAKPKTIENYIEVLIKELKHYKDVYHNLETIYIGGGTPSSIPLHLLEKLLKEINGLIDFTLIKEFTIEMNPNDINEDLVRLIKEYSVNRVSIGVQTVNQNLLKILNRNHTKNDIIEALTILKNNSVSNINLDFIYGIPTQTIEHVKEDLGFLKEFMPKHISYYSLILEEKTILDYQIRKGLIKPLDEDLVADFSDLVKTSLKGLNYNHYETSNYSLKGYESIHNLIYWNLEEYLGIGLGAASQYNNLRLKNKTSLSSYIIDCSVRNEEDYSPLMEYILMGLRKTKGISISEFRKRFKKDIFDCFPLLKKHLENKLIVVNQDYLSFTELGQDLANQVYLDII